MKKIFLILVFILVPTIAHGFTASDFIVNNQSTYSIPPGSTNVLILDLTLPQPASGQTWQLQSIKINNIGTAFQYHVARLYIYEDGPSPGWDGDENKRFTKLESPFFDVLMASDAFSKSSARQRIFVTVDIASGAATEKTIQLQLAINSLVFTNGETGPTDNAIAGLARMILAGAELPAVPFAPVAKTPEILSASAIRWHFIDMSNNEFGFKILDGNLKEVARVEQANISYIDETGLQPNTEYSGRRIIAFNDMGESSVSVLSIFPAAQTLSLPPTVGETPVEETPVEEIPEETPVEEKPAAEMTADEIKAKIAELQLKLIELLNQLIQLLQEQLAALQ